MTTESTSTEKRPPPIAAGDDRTTCGTFSIALHWLTEVLVVIQFVPAETWEWFERPTECLVDVAYMSFAIILSAVIVMRIAWRLMPSHRTPPAVSGWTDGAPRTVHVLLYAMLVVEAVLGYVLRWGSDRFASGYAGLHIERTDMIGGGT